MGSFPPPYSATMLIVLSIIFFAYGGALAYAAWAIVSCKHARTRIEVTRYYWDRGTVVDHDERTICLGCGRVIDVYLHEGASCP